MISEGEPKAARGTIERINRWDFGEGFDEQLIIRNKPVVVVHEAVFFGIIGAWKGL